MMRLRLRGYWLGGVLLAIAAGGSLAQSPADEPVDLELPPSILESGPEATPVNPDEESSTVFIDADHITGREGIETVGEGHVEMRRGNTSLFADRLTYWPIEDEMEAVGNVQMRRDADVMSGPYLRLKITDNVGYFDQPHYVIQRGATQAGSAPTAGEPSTGSGDAARLDFEGEGHYRLTDATYSTCIAPNRDWYTRADQIKLDYDREVGEADNVTIVFKETPILYSPWLSFSLNSQRKSGLLAPTFGSSSTSGLDLTVPWYWNIAPNMDATLSPRILSRRGLQLNGEFRYLDYAYNGEARIEYLPNDRLTGTNRSAYSWQHNQTLAPNWTAQINVNGASDDAYFSDLSSRLSVTSQTNLIRDGLLTYGGGWWSATLRTLRYQTLQDPSAPVTEPYYMLPQLQLNASRPDLPAGLAFNFKGEYVDFGHPTLVRGKRTTLYPQLSWPLQTAAFFVTPKIGYHTTRYQLDRQGAGVPSRLSRDVPIFSVDAGLVMERDMTWQGRSLLQTLEPRLYYVKIPYREQSLIPVFDSGLADLNFAQMFTENRYSGSDRIGDADQVTAALTSRVVDPVTGSEILRGAVGQRFYNNSQRVTLPSEVARTASKTDILAGLSGKVYRHTWFDAGWQYSPSLNHTERHNIGVRYQPEINKVINAGYRFTRDQIQQIDLSGQWPISGNWYAVGRYNYSLREKSLVEGLAGLEYDGGCWVARFVLHRLATQTGSTSTAIYFQLELNGLARIGSNPVDMLKRNIPGYGVINQPTADPIFGSN